MSVVVPAYDEAATLEAIAERILALSWTTELLISDDGSTDETPTIAASLAALDGRVRLIRLPHNMGKGAASPWPVRNS